MAVSTPVVYNAAVSGMIAGLMISRANTSSTATDYLAVVNAANTFAAALDTSIGAVTGLVSAGATVVPATAANANIGESYPALIQGICMAYWATRGLNGSSLDTTASTYTTAVAAVKAQYTEALTVFQTA